MYEDSNVMSCGFPKGNQIPQKSVVSNRRRIRMPVGVKAIDVYAINDNVAVGLSSLATATPHMQGHAFMQNYSQIHTSTTFCVTLE